jgi:hypothetical protein
MIRAAMSRVGGVSALALVVLTFAGGGSSGCATAQENRIAARDLRSAATVDRSAPRILLAGPALLMHVDVQGQDSLSLYTVTRRSGSEADCLAGGAPSAPLLLQGGISNRLNLKVGADQLVCVVAPSRRLDAARFAPGRIQVLWHARRHTSWRTHQMDGTDRPGGETTDVRALTVAQGG